MGDMLIMAPLRDRYVAQSGRGLISGVQALVRLMLVQAERDRRAGLNTAGFVSGYRGSPLGTLDTTFGTVSDLLTDRRIIVQPAVNEELAATAVGGTQHIAMTPGATADGVFSLWYGKGPGVDRAADAIRHANYAGASQFGGVVVAIGDDHQGKSSSLVVNSNGVCASLNLPLLFPSDPAEILSFGVHGYAASRLSGSWIGMKILPEVADSVQTVSFEDVDMVIESPEVDQPADGLHIRWPDTLLEQEHRQHRYRLRAVQRYVRANGLDRRVLGHSGARIGIISAGKSWRDLSEALALLEIDADVAERLGISSYKLAMIWPVEPEGLTDFASGLDTLIVVEEKGPFVESQIRSLLYGLPGAPRRIERISIGGLEGLPDDGVLTPEDIAAQLGALIGSATGEPRLAELAASLAPVLQARTAPAFPTLRKAHFCSGCPHNTSTALPEGSRASAGIGCHSMAVWIADNTAVWAQMGGEGIQWTGLSHFTTEKHVFANMGDGTYFHSGILAIRQAVAAGVTMTYKILFNDAVAMTGGQKVDGELTIPRLVDQLKSEGVQTIRIVSSDTDKYGTSDFRVDVPVDTRDDLDRVQRELRDVSGVSVLIYDQMCATELRRRRKRGTLPDPGRRVFINEAVCEGCGDCSVKSNCLSVEPLETELGTKRQINQSTCNKDMSCLRGFCPSFMSVEGGELRRSVTALEALSSISPPAPIHSGQAGRSRILVAGIGGTGVVTIGALLTVAGQAEGHTVAVLDEVGMAQKGGAVQSSIHIAPNGAEIRALKIPSAGADLILACDQIVANGKDIMAAISPGRTIIVSNGDVAITGDFTRSGSQADPAMVHLRLERRAGNGNVHRYNFTSLAEHLLGDAIGSNLMMVGFAVQKGLIPVAIEAIEGAIELNGTAVSMNKRALRLGRLLAVEPEAVLRSMEPERREIKDPSEVIEHRSALLEAYQNRSYAERFRSAIAPLQEAEKRLGMSEALSNVAAASLSKLMTYKDEYEVARLFVDGDPVKRLKAKFEGKVRVSFHLAPPLFAKRDPVSGHLRKRQFGPWILPVFAMLARLKILRGTWADPFGYTAERRCERMLIVEFEDIIRELANGLNSANFATAESIVNLPLEVKGFGHVKEASVARYRRKLEQGMREFHLASEGKPAREHAADGLALA